MLLDNHPTLNIKIGYQFHFGLEFHENAILEDICNTCPFKTISSGCYNTHKEHIKQCFGDQVKDAKDASILEEPHYLKYYQKNIHRRISPFYREFRESLLIEFKSIPINSIIMPNNIVINTDSSLVSLKVQISLQKIGIGSIYLWIENFHPENEAQWHYVRDPGMISISIDSTEYNRDKWPLIEFVRNLILKCHILYSNKEMDISNIENSKYIKSDHELDYFLNKHFKYFSDYGAFTKVNINNYPILFIKYNLTTEEMNKEIKTNASDIRLSLCGDINWKFKNQKIIQSSIVNSNTSSRDSIKWIVNSEGTVKLCSNELETSVEESFMATILETDIILTMRYFLQTIGSLIYKLGTSKLSHHKLTLLRHKLFTDIDNYCNIEVSHKDTTRTRLVRIKEIFKLNEMYDKVVDRFDLLNNRLITTHSVALEKQQTLLTLTFGFFGALSVLLKIYEKLDLFGTVTNIILSILGSTLISIFLYYIISLIHKKIKRN